MTKVIDEYDLTCKKHTEFFSSYDPEYLQAALIESLNLAEVIKPVISANKYKLKFSISKILPGEKTDLLTEAVICIRLLKVCDSKICVEFQKVKGDQALFIETFQEMRDKSLKWSNN